MFNVRVLSVVALIAALAGLSHALTFQHGINGYYGGEDASISEATWGAGPYSRGGDDLARAGGYAGYHRGSESGTRCSLTISSAPRPISLTPLGR